MPTRNNESEENEGEGFVRQSDAEGRRTQPESAATFAETVEETQPLLSPSVSGVGDFLAKLGGTFVVDLAEDLPYFDGFKNSQEVKITAPVIFNSRRDAQGWLKLICLKVMIGSILLTPQVLDFAYGSNGLALVFGFLAVAMGIPANQLATPTSSTSTLLAPFFALITIVIDMIANTDALILGGVYVGFIGLQTLVMYEMRSWRTEKAFLVLLSVLPSCSILGLLWRRSQALAVAFTVVLTICSYGILVYSCKLWMMDWNSNSMRLVASSAPPILMIVLFLAVLELMSAGTLILATFEPSGNSSQDAEELLQRSHSSLTFGMSLSLLAAVLADNNKVQDLVKELSIYSKIAVKLKVCSELVRHSRPMYVFDEVIRARVTSLVGQDLFQPMVSQVVMPFSLSEALCLVFVDGLVSRASQQHSTFTPDSENLWDRCCRSRKNYDRMSSVVVRSSFALFEKAISLLEDIDSIYVEDNGHLNFKFLDETECPTLFRNMDDFKPEEVSKEVLNNIKVAAKRLIFPRAENTNNDISIRFLQLVVVMYALMENPTQPSLDAWNVRNYGHVYYLRQNRFLGQGVV